ncbi:MAG TPA: GAF and ANTAR domain-containing protein [Microlunatus sp.]
MQVDSAELTASLRRLAARHAEGGGVIHALQQVNQACVDLFHVGGSGIMVADEQNITRYLTASDGLARSLEEAESATGQGPCTEAFVNNRVVASSDVTIDGRWPALAAEIRGLGVFAVLGVPVRIGGIPVGTLDAYFESPHEWDDSERQALARYGDVVETVLSAALQAHTTGVLAGQLQYALDYRVVIERAVGYLMAQDKVDAVVAFNRLRRVARSRRTKIGAVAEHVLSKGRLPAAQG